MCCSLVFDTTSRFAQRHLNRRSLGKNLPVDAVQSHLRRESAPFRMSGLEVSLALVGIATIVL